MTLRQMIQAAPEKAAALITKLAATSNQAVKSRESLYAELSDELSRYVEFEEQHLLPLLRRRPETKDLAVNALKGNKDLRASIEKLSSLPKDNDALLAALADLNKGFQQHVRNERKELLPAVLKVLNDDEAAGLAANIEGAVKEAETAKRDEKREERREQAEQAERQAEEAKQAAAAERAVVKAQEEAERVAREATEKVADVMERGAAAVQDRARLVTETLTERAQQVASDTQEAMTIYSDSARRIAEDMQVVSTTAAASVQVLSEVSSAWTTWFEKATRVNTEASQKLFRARSMKDIAETQREFATGAMHNWMERRTAMLQIAQRSSMQALSPLHARVNDAA